VRLKSRRSAGLIVAVTGLAVAAVIVPRVGPSASAAAAVTATQAAAVTSPPVPYTPYPVTGTVLYVDNVGGICSDSGPGSDTQPFCTIGAAASAVQPGQTVVVEPGSYSDTTISVQGTAQAPITFDAIEGAIVSGPVAGTPALAISGARNVALDGFSGSGSSAPAFDVTGGSSGITINGGFAYSNSALPAIEVDGTSSDVTVSRMAIRGLAGVQVDSGASGVIVSGNTILPDHPGTWGVLVTDAPGTDVTGNTINDVCSGGISIAGASAGVTVENNIVQPSVTTSCTAAAATAISVSAESESGSVVGYNLIDPTAGEPLYNWGGASYTSLADFQQASGQGAEDIAASPGLGTLSEQHWLVPGPDIFYYPLTANSPAIDSADANAPGELPTDQLGNPRTDDPNVPNTGTGAGYYDRGAMELEGGMTFGENTVPASSGPLTATFSVYDNPGWTTNGQLPTLEVNFGDGTPAEITRETSVTHTYPIAGAYGITFEESEGCCGQYDAEDEAVVGADYTPVTPDRILDTRAGTGTGHVAPVPANGTLTLPIPAVGGVSAADMSAVVMNVTVASPAKGGNLTVYPGSGPAPTVSNLNFSPGQTVPNLVTVQVANGEVSFKNNSSGTVEVIADLEGFYGPGGYGYQPGTPARVLDTRSGTGAQGPVAANGVLKLDLSGKVPADTAAVAMNLTVTGPQKGGHLTVYPDGAAEPIASNVNFTAGETVPNLVIVPVTNGVVDIANASSGTVQLVDDLEGYFSSTAPDSFVPMPPTRQLDTRTLHSPLAAHGTISLFSATVDDPVHPQTPVAAVDNVTVTSPAKPGNLIVYPAGAARPGVSNLNFSVNETVPNLVIAKTGTYAQISYYNNSPGQLQLIVDEYGYYMNAG